MPIVIPNDIPAYKILKDENIFVMSTNRAVTQDIRPIDILILNLMPLKSETETQLCRLLANSSLQVNLTLIAPSNHEFKNSATYLAFSICLCILNAKVSIPNWVKKAFIGDIIAPKSLTI